MKTIQEIKEAIKIVFSGSTDKVKSITTLAKDDDKVKYIFIAYGQIVMDSVKICIIGDSLHSVDGRITVYQINDLNKLLEGESL